MMEYIVVGGVQHFRYSGRVMIKGQLRGESPTASKYLIATGSVALATGSLALIGSHINATTVALAFLLVVLVIATLFGSRPAFLASLLSVLSFNFLFLPP